MEQSIAELLTESNLKRLLAGKSIGESPPWRKPFAPRGRNRIMVARDCLAKHTALKTETGFNQYGYSSYAELFVYPRDGSTTKILDSGATEICGIRVWLALRAPLAIYGLGKITRDVQGGSSGFLHPSALYNLPTRKWKDAEEQLCACLEGGGFYWLSKSLAQEPLAFEVDIPTNLGERPYCVFDAVFHWID